MKRGQCPITNLQSLVFTVVQRYACAAVTLVLGLMAGRASYGPLPLNKSATMKDRGTAPVTLAGEDRVAPR